MTSAVVDANIAVHTRMAATYNTEEPHFRPENRAKVKGRLQDVRRRAPGGRLIDFGCGTGFILGLAHDLFDVLHGVDVTQAMLDRVDLSPGNITVHNCPAERTPFADASFDAASAYSFIHHVQDYGKVFAEAHRVLVPGGIFYVDLEPNRLFWLAMSKLDGNNLPPIVQKAWDSTMGIEARIEKEYGIPQDVFRNAEYGKSVLGGVDPTEVEQIARSVGFSKVDVKFDWFLGQAEVMHGRSFDEAARVDAYLRDIAPLSSHLFKYIHVEMTK